MQEQDPSPAVGIEVEQLSEAVEKSKPVFEPWDPFTAPYRNFDRSGFPPPHIDPLQKNGPP